MSALQGLNGIKPNRKTRVAAYARVSVSKDGPVQSLKNQIDYYSNFIYMHSIPLLLDYIMNSNKFL